MELSLIKETIKKVDSKYVLYPKNGGKRLGTHSSKESAEKQERAIQVSKHGRSGSELKEKLRDIIRQEKKSIKEKSPEGWEDTVKAMKDEPDIDNPWALAHWMDKRGYESHKESVNESKQKFVIDKEKFSPDVKKQGDQYIVRYKVRKPEQYGYEYPISKKMLRFMKKKLGEFTFITNAGLELHSREIKGGKWEGIIIKKGYGVFESISEEITDWQGGYNDEFKFKKGQLIRDINPDCPHHGSEGEVTKVTKDEVTYTVRNNGKTYKVGDELTKTKDQLTPLSLDESINEKISKEEWAQYPKYARKLKPYMQRLLKVRLKVRVIKQANHNPWIEIRVARFGKDIIPNDFRKKALKVIGGSNARDMDNINYGNIRSNSISLLHNQWVKLLGNKVKESINEAKRGTDLYFVIDQLVNSMEFYDEREFIKHIGKETKYSLPQLKKLYKAYYKLSPRKRFSMSFNWEKWLKKQGISETKGRDYKAEYQARKSYYYEKYQSSTKSKKYRAELNKYNRQKGTYGNGDGMDASHKGGKIMGFEKESTNRGRREKSRLKKEAILKLRQMIREELLLTEKKELGGALINKIERLTDINNHTEARITLAKEVDKKLEQAYEGLNTVQDYLRRANETNVARDALDKKLFALAKKKFSDYESIERAF